MSRSLKLYLIGCLLLLSSVGFSASTSHLGDSGNEYSFLFIGESGAGKTSLINNWLNLIKERRQDDKKDFFVSTITPDEHLTAATVEDYLSFDDQTIKPLQSATSNLREYQTQQDGKTYSFWDTPGFGDTRPEGLSDDQILQMINDVLTERTFTAIILVLNPNVNRLHTSLNRMITSIRSSIFEEDISDHTFMVYSRTLQKDRANCHRGMCRTGLFDGIESSHILKFDCLWTWYPESFSDSATDGFCHDKDEIQKCMESQYAAWGDFKGLVSNLKPIASKRFKENQRCIANAHDCIKEIADVHQDGGAHWKHPGGNEMKVKELEKELVQISSKISQDRDSLRTVVRPSAESLAASKKLFEKITEDFHTSGDEIEALERKLTDATAKIALFKKDAAAYLVYQPVDSSDVDADKQDKDFIAKEEQLSKDIADASNKIDGLEKKPIVADALVVTTAQVVSSTGIGAMIGGPVGAVAAFTFGAVTGAVTLPFAIASKKKETQEQIADAKKYRELLEKGLHKAKEKHLLSHEKVEDLKKKNAAIKKLAELETSKNELVQAVRTQKVSRRKLEDKVKQFAKLQPFFNMDKVDCYSESKPLESSDHHMRLHQSNNCAANGTCKVCTLLTDDHELVELPTPAVLKEFRELLVSESKVQAALESAQKHYKEALSEDVKYQDGYKKLLRNLFAALGDLKELGFTDPLTMIVEKHFEERSLKPEFAKFLKDIRRDLEDL